MQNNSALTIYIHWPFCISKCPYCNFSSFPAESTLKNAGYLDICDGYKDFGDALLHDLQISIEKISVASIGSIFFGGGTPSLMSVSSVSNIIEFLYKNYSLNSDIEITLEANPATFDSAKMNELHSVGINRLSLGVQSFSNATLGFLGRVYNSKKALEASAIVSNIFDNFSMDIMYGYESQTIESLERDMQIAVDFGCKHISCYQLTFEENTPFYQQLIGGKINQINSETEAEFYAFTENFLQDHGIYRYEVSNYSRSGYESKHNMGYWEYEDYLGIGPGAHSRITINGKKHEILRTQDIFKWLNADKNAIFSSELSYEEMLQEIIIVGLRIKKGLTLHKIHDIIPSNIIDKIIPQKKLQLLYEKKLIEKYNTKIQLTNSGMLKLNAVVEFLLN